MGNESTRAAAPPGTGTGTGTSGPTGLWVGPLTKGAALCLLGVVAPAAKLFFLVPILLFAGAALMAVGIIAGGVQLGIESAHRRAGRG